MEPMRPGAWGSAAEPSHVELGRDATASEASAFREHMEAENATNSEHYQHYIKDDPETRAGFSGAALNQHVLPLSDGRADMALSTGDPHEQLLMARDPSGLPHVQRFNQNQFTGPSAAKLSAPRTQPPVEQDHVGLSQAMAARDVDLSTAVIHHSAASVDHRAVALQTKQDIRDLASKSPSFNKLLGDATERGRNPVTIHYGPTISGRDAEYHTQYRNIVVNPFHQRVDPRQGGSGTLSAVAFEMTNVNHDAELTANTDKARGGFYEDIISRRRKEGQQLSTPASVLYAMDQEKVEYKGTRIHHEIISEAQAAGMPLHPGADTFAGDFASTNPRNWNNLNNYLQSQADNGHTEHWVNEYNRSVGRL